MSKYQNKAIQKQNQSAAREVIVEQAFAGDRSFYPK